MTALSLVFVATHNIMHGHGLDDLVEHYRELGETRRLAGLCVQENRSSDDRSFARSIAAEMGSRFAEVSDPCQCGKGMVYDRDQLELRDHQLIKLPQLESLSWLERRYIAGGVPDQRFLQVASFHSELGPTTFVNFHLDTAGGNGHRRVQVEAIADFIRSIDDTIVVCGDTNAFAMSRKGHPKLLRWLLEPIAELGIEVDTDDTPTHFFARQHEPLLTHRLTVWAGKIGIDFPRRYDVVGSNATVLERGVRSTRASDHDLVWAKISG